MTSTSDVTEHQDELRARAVARVKKRRDLGTHVLVYLLANTFIVVIWLMTSSAGFFWPIFPMAGWGIGLAMNAWDVWRGDSISEETIAREIARIQSGK
jgi:2TM domain